MEKVGIIGYGRFGKLLEKLLSKEFDVSIYDPALKNSNEDDVLQADTIFVATPIREFENVIKHIATKLNNSTVIDLCSVKIYPVDMMKKHLPENIGIIATHPMFGPDSIDANDKLNFVMHKVRDEQNCYEKWKNFFKKEFNVIELTPEEHDKLAAESQSIVHFVARALKEFGVKSSAIDTQGFKNLLTLVDNNCKDTWELFSDLQNYNPYTKAMFKKLEVSCNTIKSKLDRDNG